MLNEQQLIAVVLFMEVTTVLVVIVTMIIDHGRGQGRVRDFEVLLAHQYIFL